MTAHKVVILGAGAAGTAAAQALAQESGIATTLVGRSGETPYSRMLIKGVAYGQTPAEFVRLPMPQTNFIADTALRVDTQSHTVHLESGAELSYDSLIIATGSRARRLDEHIPGAAQAEAAGSVVTLHSLDDAVHMAQVLPAGGSPQRVAIAGGGLIASETASTLLAQGHQLSMIARSQLPGVATFGRPIAEHIAAEHRSRVHTFFGRAISAIHSETDATVITLDDGSEIRADLLVVALGTEPVGPEPWASGLHVDERLSVPASKGVYAAGGVATHVDAQLGEWRIDHWDDGVAQGNHAARMLLHDLGRGDDPGSYRPRSAHLAMIYGQAVAGAGLTGHTEGHLTDREEFVVVHEHAGAVIGVSGIDAVGTVYQWAPRLHEMHH